MAEEVRRTRIGCREARETRWRRGDSDERVAVGRKVEIQEGQRGDAGDKNDEE